MKSCEVDKRNLATCNQTLKTEFYDDHFWDSTTGNVIKAVVFFGLGYGTAKVVHNGSIL